MKTPNFRRRQTGAFAIELAFVLVGLIMIFYFMTDLSHKLLVRADLDRTSFSLANILKERTRYYDERFELNANDASDMTTLAARLMNTTANSVAIKIEALHDRAVLNEFTSDEYTNLSCSAPSITTRSDLAPVENGNIFSLYQVTLCEENDSWFAQVWGDSSSPTITITSSSVVIGR
ncbi:membrane associated secretion system protein [Vibrio owensii]|uniref:tight adherence pilus pseudopilin TadF n=1 Tax=Vibrio owensii TaxID=696485 RepID=UPI000EFD769F|nr:tight adherence pilus pseudopilin TadF [Vibrio owensii]AYO18907.1 membrane associated secretion system protein [Vibrio owensii]